MNVTFPEYLADLMSAQGMRPADLARAAGLTHVAIGNYLKGRVPKYEQAQKIAHVFGIGTDQLLNPPPRRFKPVIHVMTQTEMDAATGGHSTDWRSRALEAERKLEALKKNLIDLVKQY